MAVPWLLVVSDLQHLVLKLGFDPGAMTEELADDLRGATKKRLQRMMTKMTNEELLALEEKGKIILEALVGGVKRRAPNPSGSSKSCFAKMQSENVFK